MKKNSAINEAGKLFLTVLLISTWSCMWGGKEEKKVTIDLDQLLTLVAMQSKCSQWLNSWNRFLTKAPAK